VKVQFRNSFEKDLRKLRNAELLAKITTVVREVETAEALEDVGNLKKLSAKGAYYRIRVGDYRIGIVSNGSVVTFTRVLHRREIYRNFP